MKKYLKYIELIIFIILAIWIGSNHEPWSDEAQSWLIARDASVSEIVTNIASYEGCFPLWYLIIKLFIFCGLKYQYFYIIPIIFSAIGVWIFLNNEKIPLYIRVLLPFTYYVFYQYAIVARNYCLFFLAFSLLTFTYKYRKEKPYRYILNLVLLSFISLHGMLISGILALLYFIEILKEKKYKNIYSLVFIGIIWLIEIILLVPRNDIYITINALNGILEIIINIFFNIIVINSNFFLVLQNIITFLIFLTVTIISALNKNNKAFLFNEIGMIIFFMTIRAIPHHFGIFFFIVVFGIIINYECITAKNKKLFDNIMKIMLILYVIYTIQSSYMDLKADYSGSKKMAEYIKQNCECEENSIAETDYYQVGILPYFDFNILKNRNTTYFEWKKSNDVLYLNSNYEDNKEEFINTLINDVKYVLLITTEHDRNKILMDYLNNSNEYELLYQVEGNQFYKNYYYRKEGFILYKKISE